MQKLGLFTSELEIEQMIKARRAPPSHGASMCMCTSSAAQAQHLHVHVRPAEQALM